VAPAAGVSARSTQPVTVMLFADAAPLALLGGAWGSCAAATATALQMNDANTPDNSCLLIRVLLKGS
jgi:hypothetical protein